VNIEINSNIITVDYIKYALLSIHGDLCDEH